MSGSSEVRRVAETGRARPPMEVVLPAPYYVVLVLEAVGLAGLHFLAPEDSGGARVGQLLGWAGTISMIVMHVYSIRRRVRALRDFGPLRRWLHFHIFMGLQGALLVSYHASHLRTLGNLAGVTILVVLTVVASGCFGRYLFSMIPKGLTGERLSARQIEEELALLTEELRGRAPTAELDAALAGYAGGARLGGRMALAELVREDLRSRRALGALDRALARALASKVEGPTGFNDALKLDAFFAAARRRVLLSRRLITFAGADAVFRNWTLFHKPLTFLLLGLTLLHVLGHYVFAAYGS